MNFRPLQILRSSSRELETLALAGLGAAILLALRAPAAPIIGGMVATATAALAGRDLTLSMTWRAPLFFLMGLATGATLTPTALSAAATWPFSMLVLPFATLGIQAVGCLVFRWTSGADWRTSFFASAPGALSTVMALATERGADVPRVAVAQTMRVALLLACAPFVMRTGMAPPPLAIDPVLLTGLPAWALMISAALLGWLVARWLGWPLPPLVGALLGSAPLHAAGVVGVAPSALVMTVAMAGIGGAIGARFSGLKIADIVRFLPSSLAALLAAAIVAIPIGIAAGLLSGVGIAPGLLAYAPGSMETMIAMAVALNAHPAYVAAHHTVRLVILITTVPLMSAWASGADRRAAQAAPPPHPELVD